MDLQTVTMISRREAAKLLKAKCARPNRLGNTYKYHINSIFRKKESYFE